MDRFLGEPQGRDEIDIGDFVRRAFVHDDVMLVADVDEVEVGCGLLLVGRIDDKFAFDAADAGGAQRAGPGNIRNHQGSRGRENGEDVRIILSVGGHQDGLHLDFVVPALGEEGADRAVRETAGEDFLFGRPAFAFEIATRETAGGGGALTVIHGEREEFLAGFGLGSGNGGRQDDGFTELYGHRAICLFGIVAGFNDQILSPDGNDYFVRHVKERPPAPRNFNQPPRHEDRGE